MTSKDKLICVVVVAIALMLSAIAWACSWGYVMSWRAFTDAGYVQEPITTTTGTRWVKP